MPSDYAYVAIFLIVGVGFAVLTLIASWVLRRWMKVDKFSKEKLTSYECGERPIGEAWSQFNVRYYLIALIFLIFDVEIIFVAPWVLVYKQLGMFCFMEMLVFIVILFTGLIYAWRKGVLRWM